MFRDSEAEGPSTGSHTIQDNKSVEEIEWAGEPGAKAGETCLCKPSHLAHLVKLEVIGYKINFYKMF